MHVHLYWYHAKSCYINTVDKWGSRRESYKDDRLPITIYFNANFILAQHIRLKGYLKQIWVPPNGSTPCKVWVTILEENPKRAPLNFTSSSIRWLHFKWENDSWAARTFIMMWRCNLLHTYILWAKCGFTRCVVTWQIQHGWELVSIQYIEVRNSPALCILISLAISTKLHLSTVWYLSNSAGLFLIKISSYQQSGTFACEALVFPV